MGNETREQSEPLRERVEAAQPDLTEDERTVLELGINNPLIAIGRWKKPVESLVARGLMADAGAGVNAYTTPAGKKALDAAENKVFGELVAKAREVETPHNEIRLDVESAAHLLARIASRSARVTGKPPVYEAREWSNVLLKRTLEILGG